VVRVFIRSTLAIITAFAAAPTFAQDAVSTYPNRLIRLVVPFAPGGPNDIIARLVGHKLQEAWGQPVVVENRPGAGGNIGMEQVANSPPDGYSLVMSSLGPLAISPYVYSKLPYDPNKDLAPITLAAMSWMFVAVHPSVPATSLKELIALANAKPDLLNFGSSGNATPSHLGGALFKALSGTKLIHVPYRGAGGSVPALLRGEVQVLIETPPLLVPLAQTGQVRILAAARSNRSPLLPDVPTIGEAGLPGAEVGSWYGFHAPAGTPKPIIDKLHDEIVKALSDKEVRERLAAIGAEVVTDTPDEFAAFIRVEQNKWGDIIKSTGIKFD
jgi:tripartite-type tricarboxylate transporter receptor subunit TctC